MSASANHENDRTIVSCRVFDADRARLFGAFADPAQLATWWGPAGFLNEIREFDFRPGGRWRIAMRAPDGQVFENDSEFRAIELNRRIVFQHLEPVHAFTMTIEFADAPGGTRVTWRMAFESAGEFARVRSFVAAANEENFDRLAACVPAARSLP